MSCVYSYEFWFITVYLCMSQQMSTTRSRKRKSEVLDEPQQLITHVKAVQVGRKGNFHYFGKSAPDQKEERLTISWLDCNRMGRSWRRTSLRGKKGRLLGKWSLVPVGSSSDKKLPSKNPCIPGKNFIIICIILILILFRHLFSRCTSHVRQRDEYEDSLPKDVSPDENFSNSRSVCQQFSWLWRVFVWRSFSKRSFRVWTR